MNYVTAKEAKSQLHINATTLKSWKDKGIIRYKKLTVKKFLYDIDSVGSQNNTRETNRKHVIYARVSNTKQHNDLLMQIEMIKSYCISIGIQPDAIYKEIASGMNENRKELNILIDEVIQGHIDTVYASFKDRLARFGFELLEMVFRHYGCSIIVINDAIQNKSYEQEMSEDLISIIHYFSMKMHSHRRKLNRIKKELMEED